MIIWDSKKLSSGGVLTSSFSISIKFLKDGIRPLWLSLAYGPNNAILRKDFWVELLDLFNLTFPFWCVGDDFNVTRGISEKLCGFGLTTNMSNFDEIGRASCRERV